jgi:hypothetical protein
MVSRHWARASALTARGGRLVTYERERQLLALRPGVSVIFSYLIIHNSENVQLLEVGEQCTVYTAQDWRSCNIYSR